MGDQVHAMGFAPPVQTRRPGKKSLPWRQDPEILERLPTVERLHIRGLSNYAIARALDVAEATVREDLKRVRALWRERVGGEIDDLKARAAAELEDVRQRALGAAEFDERAERAVLYGRDADDKPIDVHLDDKGSASFRGQKAQALNVARQAIVDKAKILGVAVDRTEHTAKDGAPLVFTLRLGEREPPDA